LSLVKNKKYKIMELNLLNKRLSDKTSKDVSELQFYRYFLLILNESQGILTTKQLDMVSYMMSKGTSFKCKGSGILDIMNKELYMSKQHISNVRSQLIKKEIINEDGSLSKLFAPLVHLVDQKREIKLVLPMKIKENEY